MDRILTTRAQNTMMEEVSDKVFNGAVSSIMMGISVAVSDLYQTFGCLYARHHVDVQVDTKNGCPNPVQVDPDSRKT